ncbi:MAG: dockerin type I domain-containing protein, partial [Verrucomicrobiota bacterium]|nr:dockerin type I domain-containing protein [Verrucomicrobiota bacterium]
SGLTIRSGLIAGNGAGVIVGSGNVTLTDCAITNNGTMLGSGFGGGLYNSPGASLSLVRCTLINNFAPTAGGGVYNDGTFTATNCTFLQNVSVNGGGITSKFQNGAPSSVLRNCTVTGNYATSTLTTSGEGGGGIYAEGGAQQFHLANTIVAVNSSSSNPQTNPDVRGNFTSDGDNFIGIIGFAAGLTNGVNGDQVGTSAQPRNPLLDSALRNNGGPTDTVALLNGSTAINAGNNNLAPVTDQRGYFRAGVSDIGAFEANGTPPPAVPVASIVSRKIHIGAGSFEVLLPGVECRTGGATGDYTVVFKFVNPLASVGTAGVTAGTGQVSASAIGTDTHEYVVSLTGVSNAQTINVGLTNVTDSLGNNSGMIAASMGVLLGDTSGDGFVNGGDSTQTRNRAGQTASATNFRSDVNLDGFVNSGDSVIVRARSGTFVP